MIRRILGLAVMIAVVSVPAAMANVMNGLEALWQFNGNGNDATGHGYDLTLVGNPSFTAGRFGQALELNGTGSQYAVRPINDAAFNFGSNNFTIQIWADFFSRNPSEQTLIEKFTGGGGPGWTLTTPGCDTQFYSLPGTVLNAGGCLPTNQWLQFVLERSGPNFDLFIDGHLVATSYFTGALSPSSFPLLIGRRDPADGRNFNVNGAIDDVAIWDRALTQDEISWLYHNDFPVPEPATIFLLLSGLGTAVVRRRQR